MQEIPSRRQCPAGRRHRAFDIDAAAGVLEFHDIESFALGVLG